MAEFNPSRKRNLESLFKALMDPYSSRVPEVSLITKKLVAEGVIVDQSDIENDHIAFRTMGVPHLGIASLERIFLHYGYEKRDHYFFEEKRLDAYWFAPPSPEFPRIFISELRVADLHHDIQEIIYKYTNTVKEDPVDAIDLDDIYAVSKFFSQGLWQLPTLIEHRKLSSVSEYAAWVIYNRYYLNHYTLSVHNFIEGYNTIEAFNAFLTTHGIALNDAGGTIKKSPDGLLLQSSTVAGMNDVEFACGKRGKISGSYVEFAERKVLPDYEELPDSMLMREHRREGFEAANANKIFESTYDTQTQKRA